MGLLNEIYRLVKEAEAGALRSPDVSLRPGAAAVSSSVRSTFGIGQNGAPARTTTFPGAQVPLAQGARQAGLNAHFQRDNQQIRNQMVSSGAIQGAGKAPRANVLPKSEFMPLGGRTATASVNLEKVASPIDLNKILKRLKLVLKVYKGIPAPYARGAQTQGPLQQQPLPES